MHAAELLLSVYIVVAVCQRSSASAGRSVCR